MLNNEILDTHPKTMCPGKISHYSTGTKLSQSVIAFPFVFDKGLFGKMKLWVDNKYSK